MEKDKILKLLGNSMNKKVVESVSGEEVDDLWAIQFEDASVFYIACTWRLSKADEVLALTLDGLVPAGVERIAQNIKQIEGKCLRSVEVSDFYDLILHFDEGYCAEFFCDVSYYGTEDGQEYYSNWKYDCPSLNKWLMITNLFEEVWEE